MQHGESSFCELLWQVHCSPRSVPLRMDMHTSSSVAWQLSPDKSHLAASVHAEHNEPRPWRTHTTSSLLGSARWGARRRFTSPAAAYASSASTATPRRTL